MKNLQGKGGNQPTAPKGYKNASLRSKASGTRAVPCALKRVVSHFLSPSPQELASLIIRIMNLSEVLQQAQRGGGGGGGLGLGLPFVGSYAGPLLRQTASLMRPALFGGGGGGMYAHTVYGGCWA